MILTIVTVLATSYVNAQVDLTDDNRYTTWLQCQVAGVDYQEHIESL